MAKNDDPAGFDQPVKTKSDDKSAKLPPSTPEALRALAEEQLSERDDVEKAYKKAMTADSNSAEAKAKVGAVEASRDAPDTPSGGALIAAAGESNDTKRGEKYAAEKTARRWGYRHVDEV